MVRPTDSSNGLILRVRRRDGRQDEIYIAPGLTIGRSKANTVVLAGDSTVDPIQHARAEVNHDGTLCLCCRDPASTILQNGVKVSKVALEPGQQFKIGDTDFECLQATRTDKSGYENLDSSSRGCPYCHSEPVPLAGSDPRCCPTCGEEVLAIENVSDNADVQLVPATYGNFRAEIFVARGGMGLVLKGRSVSADTVPVAIKLLPATRRDSASLERFQREIDLLTQIRHPNVVRLLDSGSEAGHQYLVMEWIEGETLKDKITQSFAASRLVTFDEALPWFQQICAGLMALHRKGIVHRDLKPSNVLIDTNSVARIVDLGIAKPMSETDRSLTTTGSAPGTFVYMAPEQHVAPETVDERADIYALGVTFLELLTGQLPLGAWKPASAVNPTVPTAFGDILSQMLAQRMTDRPASISELVAKVSPVFSESLPLAATEMSSAVAHCSANDPPATEQNNEAILKGKPAPANVWWKPDKDAAFGYWSIYYLTWLAITSYSIRSQPIQTLLAVTAIAVGRWGLKMARPDKEQRRMAMVVCGFALMIGLLVWPEQVFQILIAVVAGQLLIVICRALVEASVAVHKCVTTTSIQDLKKDLGTLLIVSALATVIVFLVYRYTSNAPSFQKQKSGEVRQPSSSPRYTPDPKFKTGPQPLPAKGINGTSGSSEPKYAASRDGGVLVNVPAGWQSETSGTSTIILRKPDLVATIRVTYLTRTGALDLRTAAQRAASAGDYLELEFAPLNRLESTANALPAIQQRMEYQNSNVERVTVNTTVETPKNFVIVSGNCPKSEWAILSNNYDLVLKEIRGQSATRP